MPLLSRVNILLLMAISKKFRFLSLNKYVLYLKPAAKKKSYFIIKSTRSLLNMTSLT